MLNLFLRRIKSAYQLFVKPPKVWRPPVVCDILIYDAAGLDIILPYLRSYSFSVLHARGESINGYVLLFSIFSKRFFEGRGWLAYSEVFIKFSRPKLVITFIDNSEYFYSFSRSCNVRTLFIQNGLRTKYGDIFQFSEEVSRKNYRVDYMLLFGENISNEYKKIISGEVLIIGSLKNNFFRPTSLLERHSIRFVSQWRPESDRGCHFSLVGEGNKNFGHHEFYRSEKFLLPLLKRWCEFHGKSLEVIGCNNALSGYEKGFFDSILGSESYLFRAADSFLGSYSLADSAEMVVFIDSTLGYECLARGKRAACFSTRGEDIANSELGFGWPGAFPDRGPFWTNSKNPIYVTCILDYVDSVSDQEWSEQLCVHFKGIMDFDPGNKRFSDQLSRIMLGLTSPQGKSSEISNNAGNPN